MTDKITIEVPADAEIVINGEPYKPDPAQVPNEKNIGWGLNSSGTIERVRDLYYGYQCNAAGNWAPTEEQAMLEIKRRRLTKRFIDAVARENANHGWVADFHDHAQIKYCFLYDHSGHRVYLSYSMFFQSRPAPFYFRKQAAPWIRKLFTEAELKLIITGE